MSIELRAAINTYLPLVLDSAQLTQWQNSEWGQLAAAAPTSPVLLENCRFVTHSQQCATVAATESQTIFVPLVGPKFNGHDFIAEAVQLGATGYLFDPKYHHPDHIATSSLIRVPVVDTLKAYQALAAAHRRHTLTNTQLIAISGSCGKTTLRSYLQQILAHYGVVTSTRANENNEIGVCHTLLRATHSTDFVVCEMGMRHRHDLIDLTTIARPDVCLLSGVSKSHLSCVNSLDDIYTGKLELFKQAPQAIWLAPSADSRLLAQLYAHSANSANEVRAGCFSDYQETVAVSPQHQLAMIKVVAVTTNDQQLSTQVQLQRMVGESDVSVPLRITVDSIHRDAPKMVAAAVCAAWQVLSPAAPKITMSSDRIMNLDEMALQTQVKGRFSVVRNCADWLIIDDTYNASPASMKAGLLSVIEWWRREQHRVDSGVLILGDMLELGGETQQLHEELGGWLTHHLHELSCKVNLMWCGGWGEHVKVGLAQNSHHRHREPVTMITYNSVAELMAAPPWQALRTAVTTTQVAQTGCQVGTKKVVYIKASHGIRLAKLVGQLVSVAHSSELDL